MKLLVELFELRFGTQQLEDGTTQCRLIVGHGYTALVITLSIAAYYLGK